MTPQDVLRAVTEAEIGREIIRLVPHWYEADCGPERYSVPVGEHVAHFCNHRKLTPILSAFLTRICARTRELPLEYFVNFPSLIDVFLESFAIDWLRMHSAAHGLGPADQVPGNGGPADVRKPAGVAEPDHPGRPRRGRHLRGRGCRSSSISLPRRRCPTLPWTATCA